MDASLEGALVWRGDDGYEEARRGVLWNDWTPERFPEVIVRASSEQDVVGAVRLAREERLRVAVKGGGHSFCGSPLRDGGMLIDLSRLTELSIDPDARTASVQPAITGREFIDALAPHGLGFPIGHCGTVPMSGYLLSGGFGWNMGAWGPACLSVQRVDVVTADGELVSADAEQNSELFWAARGAGPGFFGVATRFHLALHPLPRVMRSSTYIYPLTEIEEVTRWAAEIAPAVPPSMEILLFLASPPPGGPDPTARVLGVTATAFVDTEDEAAKQLAVLETCPVLERAVVRHPNEPTSIPDLLDVLANMLPEHHRYAVDTLWSNEDFGALLPDLAGHVASAPSPRSLVMSVMPPAPPQGAPMPDTALSMFGRCLVMPYAIWEDEADDDANQDWLRDAVGSVESRAIGHYVAEADLSADSTRSIRSYAEPAWKRLQELKRKHDPDNVFHTYLGLE